MNSIYQWGIDIIKIVQTIRSDFLDVVFQGLSWFGGNEFLIFLFPLLYWCIDMTVGYQLGLMFLITGTFNYGLKAVFRQPRPEELEPGIGVIGAPGEGFPSFHAQMAVIVYGFLATRVRKTWFTIAAGILMFLVGFSRVYLGVHFPTDVIAGWLLGAVLLFLAFLFRKPLSFLGHGSNHVSAVILLNLATVVLILAVPAGDTLALIAWFWGFATGLLLYTQVYSLEIEGSVSQRLPFYLLGIVVLLAVSLAGDRLFPSEKSALDHIGRFFQNGVTGFWISFGAPWVFNAIGRVRDKRARA